MSKGRVQVEKRNVVLARLVVEYVSVEAIKANDYNPNRQSQHDFELLLRSIEDDGFTQPVVVHRATMTIVDGEHRWRACKALGYSEVPVVLVDMTPEQMRIATLRHNRARGSEDARLAAEVLRDLVGLGAVDWAQDALMMDDVEVRRLVEDMRVEDVSGIMDQASDVLGPKGVGLSVLDMGGGMDLGADQQRAKEAVLQSAKKVEERQMASGDSDYSLLLFFSGEEATVVKAALGEHSAHALLEMCREAQ